MLRLQACRLLSCRRTFLRFVALWLIVARGCTAGRRGTAVRGHPAGTFNRWVNFCIKNHSKQEFPPAVRGCLRRRRQGSPVESSAVAGNNTLLPETKLSPRSGIPGEQPPWPVLWQSYKRVSDSQLKLRWSDYGVGDDEVTLCDASWCAALSWKLWYIQPSTFVTGLVLLYCISNYFFLQSYFYKKWFLCWGFFD